MGLMWIDILSLIPENLIFSYTLVRMLHFRRPLLSTVSLCALIGVLYALTIYVIPASILVRNLSMLFTLYLCALWLGEGRSYYKFLGVVLIYLCMGISDTLTGLTASLLLEDSALIAFRENLSSLLLIRVIFLLYLIPCAYLLYMAWSRFIEKAPLSVFVLFMLFPISQYFLLLWVWVIGFLYVGKATWLLSSMIALLLCIAADIGLFYALSQLNHKHLLEQKSQLMESQLAVQLAYYDRLVENMEKTNRMRHDIKSQINAAYALLKSGLSAQAEGQLNRLDDYLQSYNSQAFCDNAVVDAVIAEKASSCSQHDIPLNVNVKLAPEIAVESVDLCSLFANLLDNAIAACRSIGDPAADKNIRLTSEVKSGMLVIAVENSRPALPAAAPAASRRPRAGELPLHGLGLLIVEEIAAKYDGRLDLQEQEALFSAMVYIPLKEEKILV